jgi:hypothetical protein
MIRAIYDLASRSGRWRRHPSASESLADETLIAAIEHSWSDDYGVGLQGWVFSTGGSIGEAEICVGDICVPITEWYPRPDVRTVYPQCPTLDCGFSVYLPRIAQHHLRIRALVRGRPVGAAITVKGLPRLMPDSFVDGSGIYNEFIALANDGRMRVLEIGSRVVSPGSQSKRDLFSRACSYTGFDYFPDGNTDVVGDAYG